MPTKKRKSYRRRKPGPKRGRARRRKRRNPVKHRIMVYRKGRGKRATLTRSKRYRVTPRRVNRKRRYRRRRNPIRVKQYFGRTRMTNAISLLIGIGSAAGLKAFVSKIATNPWVDRLFGVASIIIGATLNMRGRKQTVKSIGTGMVVFGLYDAIVSNIPILGAYLPTIGKPAFISGYDYGRSVYPTSMMGSSINNGQVEVVGSNISTNMTPEIIGSDFDLADALEMSV